MTDSHKRSRWRVDFVLLGRRGIWVAINIIVGNLLLFPALFWYTLAFHPDPKDPAPPDTLDVILFGLAVSAILICLAVVIILVTNLILRMINKDVRRGAFWWTTAGLCTFGAASNYLSTPTCCSGRTPGWLAARSFITLPSGDSPWRPDPWPPTTLSLPIAERTISAPIPT